MPLTLLVLAAGLGSRFGGSKQLEPLGPSGETLVEYAIFDAIKAGFERVLFVCGPSNLAEVRKHFDERLTRRILVDYLVQPLQEETKRRKPWGTGHAVLCAKEKLRHPFAVINADDFYGCGAFESVAAFLSDTNEADGCVVGYSLSETLSPFGAVSRATCQVDQEGNLERIVERTELDRFDGRIQYRDHHGKWREIADSTPVSMNFWGFTQAVFPFLEDEFEAFLRCQSPDSSSEFYLSDAVGRLLGNKKMRIKLLPSREKWFGLTHAEDKEGAVLRLSELVTAGHYPKDLWSEESALA